MILFRGLHKHVCSISLLNILIFMSQCEWINVSTFVGKKCLFLRRFFNMRDMHSTASGDAFFGVIKYIHAVHFPSSNDLNALEMLFRKDKQKIYHKWKQKWKWKLRYCPFLIASKNALIKSHFSVHIFFSFQSQIKIYKPHFASRSICTFL